MLGHFSPSVQVADDESLFDFLRHQKHEFLRSGVRTGVLENHVEKSILSFLIARKTFYVHQPLVVH